MGYNLSIGETEHNEEDGYRWTWVRYEKLVEGAPFNSGHNHSNSIMPSYSSWGDFKRRTGLSVHLEREGIQLIGDADVGVTPITGEICDAVVKFAAQHLRKYPVQDGGYGNQHYDSLRMRWLMFWFQWARAHCDEPVFGWG